jgi:hypothetical protein
MHHLIMLFFRLKVLDRIILPLRYELYQIKAKPKLKLIYHPSMRIYTDIQHSMD